MRKTILMSLAIIILFNTVNAQSNTFPSTGSAGVNTLSPFGNFQVKGLSDYNSSTSLFVTNNASAFGRTALVSTRRFHDFNDAWTFEDSARNTMVFAQNVSASNTNVKARSED